MGSYKYMNATFLQSILPRKNVTCGSESCYKLSKKTKKVCRPIFEEYRSSFLRELAEKLGIKNLIYSLSIMVAIVLLSAITNLVIYYDLANESYLKPDKDTCSRLLYQRIYLLSRLMKWHYGTLSKNINSHYIEKFQKKKQTYQQYVCDNFCTYK